MRSRRYAKVNYRLLVILLVVLGLLGGGAAVGYKIRRQMTARTSLRTGQAAFDKQDWSEACKHYKRYLESNPNDVDVLLRYAEAHLAVRPRHPENISYAIAAYRQVLRYREADAVICDKLCQLYFAIGDHNECAHVAQMRLKVAPADARAVMWLAKSLVVQRKGEQASELLKGFVEQHGDAIEAYSVLSQLAMVDTSEASLEAGLDWLRKAVERNPQSADALARRAQFHLRARKDPNSARADLEIADQFQPPNPTVRLMLAECWLELGELDRAQAEITAVEQMNPQTLATYEVEPEDLAFVRLKAEAILAVRREAGEAGIEVAERGLSSLNGDHRTMFLPFAAELYLAAGRIENAARCVEQYTGAMVEVGKQDRSVAERVALLQAAVQVAQNSPYDAINTLEELALGKPLYPHVFKVLARAYQLTGQTRRALASLEAYVTARPNDRVAVLELARGYLAAGLYAKACDYAELGERTDPTDVAGRLMRIEASLHREGDRATPAFTRKLVDELVQMRRKNPSDVRVRVLLASIASVQGRKQDAITELTEALAADPAALNAASLLAELYARSGLRREAVEIWQAAIVHSPDKALPRIGLANLLMVPSTQPASMPESRNYGTKVSSQPVASSQPAELTAESVLRKALVELKDQERIAAAITLGRYWLLNGQRGQAVELLQKAAAEHAKSVDLRLALLELPEVQKDAAVTTRLIEELKNIEGVRGVRWQFEQARQMLHAGDWKARQVEIEQLLTRCISADPAWSQPVTVLGRMYESLGRDDKAEEVYRKHAEGFPEDVLVTSNLLELLERQHRFTESAQVLERASGESPALSVHQVKIAIGQADYTTAINELQERLAANPQDASSRVLLARLVYAHQGDVATAMYHLGEAAKLAPDLLAVTSTRVAILLGEGRKDECVSLLNQLVQKRQDFPAYLMRAEYYVATGQVELAEKDYIELTRFKSLVAAGSETLARFYERLGRWDDVIAACNRGLEADPDSLSLKRVLVRVLVLSPDAQRREQGRAMLDKLLEGMPNDANLLCMRAGVLLREATPVATNEAVKILERVVQLNPGILLAHRYLIDIARGRGDLGRASQLAARALGANPRNTELLMIRADLENELHNVVAARELAQSVLTIDPASTAARGLLVRMALQAGDLEVAEKLNAEAMKIDPHNEEVHISQAEILNTRGHPGEAIAALESFLEAEHGRPMLSTLLALVDLYRISGDLGNATERLEKAIVLSPDGLPVLLVRMKLLAAKGEVDVLLDELTGYCKKHPQESQALVSAASILAPAQTHDQLGRLKPLFDQFIAANPDRVDGYLGLALVNYELGELGEAEQAYRRLLEIAPYHQQALNNAAWIVGVELDRPEDGLPLANKGVMRYPDDPHMLNTRGVLYYRLGMYKEAERDLDKCLKMVTQMPTTLARTALYLGRVYARQGMGAPARNAYRQALDADRDGKALSPEERAESQQMIRTAS